ncbi:lipopolysaccharide biosynthesis protein [Enterococcus sp. DIV0756]|uniref:lipopolysaccharide biosynthesis protein n=1 Tax=Enterococcus sp. DIV0756 TaxID=2774636 RepID=UPI003F28CDB0
MNRTKKFAFNSIASLSNQLIIFAMGFIVPKAILLNYGNSTNGLVTSITQFISYFNILEAGLGGAAIYALYKPLAQKDYKVISILINTTEVLYKRVGVYFLLGVLGVAFVYPLFIEGLPISNKSVFFLIIFIGLTGVINFFSLGKYRTLLTADQKSYVVLNAVSINQILNGIIIVTLSNFKVPINWVYLFALVPIGVRWLYLSRHVNKNYPSISKKYGTNVSLLKNRWDVLFLQIVGTAQSAFPTILATFMLGLVSVSVFSIYNIVIGGINLIVTMLPNSLSASFGDLIAREEFDKLKKIYSAFEYFLFIIIGIVFGVSLSMLMPFVKLYTSGVDNNVYLVQSISIAFVINGFVNGIKTPQGMMVMSAGHYRETRLRSLTQAMILVISSTILCYYQGIVGILMGSTFANFYRGVDLFFYVPKRITGMSVFESLKNLLYALIVFGIAIIYYNRYSTKMLSINSWSEWIYQSFLITALLVLVSLFLTFVFNKNHLFVLFNKIKTLKR